MFGRLAMHANIPRKDSVDLSFRQERIMELLAQGRTSVQISQNLKLSVNTVRTHIRSTYLKLGVKHRTTAVIAYLNSKQIKNHNDGGAHHDIINANESQMISKSITGPLKFCPSCGCYLADFPPVLSENARLPIRRTFDLPATDSGKRM